MGSTKVAFLAVGLACVVAAGAGGYFALRQNAVQEPASVSAPVSTAAADTTDPALTSEKPVQETEAVVAPKEKIAAKTSKKVEAKPEKATAPSVVAISPKPPV